ncbi:MAG: diaminopropionate ammonia-lyase [Desulfobacterales bacterium]|nr:diaminopropionate ammonia-lyase [Desulfobacterales bacterium]
MGQIHTLIGIDAVVQTPMSEHYPEFLDESRVDAVSGFHRSMEGYAPTPLVFLDAMAQKLGLGKILVKDESHRFGLNAFKALGASYAMARFIEDRLELTLGKSGFRRFSEPQIRRQIEDITFVTATDGNHGRAVAWAASKIGCRSVVLMPKGSSRARLAAIADEGAQAAITAFNYDDTVRHAAEMARVRGWVLLQDTAWPGYTRIPTWITQGYTTLVTEALDQMDKAGAGRPTHVFVQAGVGSFASAVVGFLANRFKGRRPKMVVVEPERAACFFRSATVGDGRPHGVTGDLDTIMAGLACGEPSMVAWEILRDLADAFVSCPGAVSETGLRLLAEPLGRDSPVVSGESGSVGMGLLHDIMTRRELETLRAALALDEGSVVLLFSTEGDTDPESYQRILARRGI